MTALFRSVLTASFHGSIVIAAVAVLRLILRGAPRKYICYLWLLAGLRLLMPFEIQSELSLQPQALPDTMIRWEQPAPMRLDAPQPLTVPASTLPGDAAAFQDAAPEATQVAAPAKASFSPLSLLPFLWVGVAAAFVVYSIHSYVDLKKKVRRAVKIPGGWESDGIETAFILGFVRPQIYIPQGMAPETRKHILAHERTHLDKGDHWIKMIGFLALALHWFNPLVWLAYILLCKDIEMACDERVVQFMELPERKEYSTALLDCSSSRLHFAASPVAFGEVSVKSRIQTILNYRKPGFWVGLLSVTAIVFVTVCLVTSPTKSAEPDAPVTAAEFVPAAQPPMEENPDWGMNVLAEAQSPTMVRLYYGVNVDGIPWDGTTIYKDIAYWIERWNGKEWQELPIRVQIPRYEGSSSVELRKDEGWGRYLYHDLDLTTIYGSLSQGDYRIGFQAKRLGETKPFYAWFHVYANALTGEEAEAVARCETAINALSQRYSYTATISESTPQGAMVPTMAVSKNGTLCQIDGYYGEFCYSSYQCNINDPTMTAWPKSFLPSGNWHISFPKGEGVISQEEISFQAAWVDVDGKEFRQTRAYRFDENGDLAGVDLLTRSPGEDGVTVQSQRSMDIQGAGYSYMEREDLTPKDSQESLEDSPWNIFFRVDDDLLKSTAGDVWMSLSADVIGVSDYTTDGSYWLERKVDGKWQKLPSKAGDPTWGDETYRLLSRTTAIDQVDWTPYYGKLEDGLYRMGKHFYKGAESIIQYAEFRIYPQGGIYGDGGEAAIAKVQAAMDKLCNGNYCLTLEYGGNFRQEPTLDSIYWKYDGLCVTDHYDLSRVGTYNGSSLTPPDDRNADLFYDGWKYMFTRWQNETYQLFFPENLSVISDQEITFAGCYKFGSSLDSLTYYSFFFDGQGELTRIEDRSGYSGTTTIFTVQPKSEEEIKAWVEKIQAEQSQT